MRYKLWIGAVFCAAILVASAAIAQTPWPNGTTAVSVPENGVQLPLPNATPPAATQNTITTTAPVSSNTTISVGTIAGQILDWATIVFGGLLSSFGTALIIKLLKNAGDQGAELLSDKLNKILLNGLNLGASTLASDLAGKGQVEIKNAVVARAVVYAQAHGADTINKLGLDPQSGEAVEALQARIATAIADPTVPTPAVLDSSAPAPAKAK